METTIVLTHEESLDLLHALRRAKEDVEVGDPVECETRLDMLITQWEKRLNLTPTDRVS